MRTNEELSRLMHSEPSCHEASAVETADAYDIRMTRIRGSRVAGRFRTEDIGHIVSIGGDIIVSIGGDIIGIVWRTQDSGWQVQPGNGKPFYSRGTVFPSERQAINKLTLDWEFAGGY